MSDNSTRQPQASPLPGGGDERGVLTPPLFTIDGDATPEQVAALVAVLSSLGAEQAPPPPTSEWAAPVRRLRTTYASGAGAWRASGLPR